MEHRLLVEVDDHRHELEVFDIRMLIDAEPPARHRRPPGQSGVQKWRRCPIWPDASRLSRKPIGGLPRPASASRRPSR
jgi:hypothetical protein